MIYFIHNPKTAGTSMVKTFEHQIYFDRFLRLNPTRFTHPKVFLEKVPEIVKERILPRREKLKVVGGHFAFGIHKTVDEPYDYVTVVRNPIERVISEYYYMKQKGFYYQELILKEDLSLEEYLHHPETRYLNNLQTRLISGVPYENGDEVNDEIYDLALKNLKEMMVVGISERFSESLALFSLVMNWKRIPIHTKANRNDERPKINAIDSYTIKRIEEREQYDLALYKEAIQIFENQLEAHQEGVDQIINKISYPSLLRTTSKEVLQKGYQIKRKILSIF